MRHVHGAPHARGRWHEFPTEWLEWEPLVSVPWRHRMKSISLAEASARLTAIRLRARQPGLHGTRCPHPLDSQTGLDCVVRGRTGMLQLRHVHLRSAAYVLAAGLHELSMCCRSDKHPADHAYRDQERWKRLKKPKRFGFVDPLAARLPAPSDSAGSGRLA